MESYPPDLQLVPGWNQNDDSGEFSFQKEFIFTIREESTKFIANILLVNKLNTNIYAIAKDLSRVQVQVRPSMDKINYKTCILAMMDLEQIYLDSLEDL